MPRVPVHGVSYAQLEEASRPQNVNAPEVVADTLYDTQLYTSGTSTLLTFFAATGAQDLTNLPAAGILPSGQFFSLYYIFLDFLDNAAGTPYIIGSADAAGDVGAIDNVGKLLLTGRPRLTFTMSNKTYGPYPASMFRGSGAAVGFGWGNLTAPATVQYGHNIVTPDGGMCFDGGIMIAPMTGFNVQITYPAALTLTGDYRVRCTLYGVTARRIS